ncbi:hypothetical protein AURDEDRAFT_187753 [Auricularia subglabra TFB-10046 SS5]|nr:hypothetical protein AURDEDRAFT_187753 [Auricularia subglabra TFB-10046 SS5]
MASEAQARKTRRSSRGPPTADQQPQYDAPPRDASRYPHYQHQQQPQRPHRTPSDRDRLDASSSSAPPSRMPTPSQRMRPDPHAQTVSPKVDAPSHRLGLRKDQAQAQPQPRTPTMPNRVLQSVVTLDAQEQVSLSDGDVPPVQGQKPRKGQRSPAKSAADDKKSRRASHVETRSPSSSSAGGGLSRKPTTRAPSGGSGQNLTSNREQQRRPSPSPDPGYPWSSSRSRPASPAQEEEQDSDSEPFSLDAPPSKGRGPTAPLAPHRGNTRPTTPNSLQSSYSGDQQRGATSPRRTDSPHGYPEARPRERDRHRDRADLPRERDRERERERERDTDPPRERDRERERDRTDPGRNKGSRVERALADVASETAKQTANKYEEYRKSTRGFSSPSESADPAPALRAPHVPSRPSTSDGVMSPTPPPRPSSSKVDAGKALGLGTPSQQPQQEQKSKSSRSFRFKSDSKPSPRQEQEAFFKNSPAAGSPMHRPDIPQTNAAPPPPPSKNSRIPSASSAASPPAPPPPSPAIGSGTSSKRPGSAGNEASTPTNKITNSASRSLKGLRISSIAARFAPGRNRNASSSPSSPASPEVSPTIESFIVSSRIPRGRGPSGLTSPPVQPIAPSDSTGSAVEMHAPTSPLVMTNPDESPTDSIAPRRPEPPSRKPSQDQRMHALMDGLGFMLGGLGSPKGEERGKRGDQQERRGAGKREPKRQDSSPALRRTPEGTPILELQGTPDRVPRPASRASIGTGTPRAASRSYYRPESEVLPREPEIPLRRDFEGYPRHEPEALTRPSVHDFDEPELETGTSNFDEEEDDADIWTPDDQFDQDYLPDHEIREEDLPPQSEDHQQLDDHQDEYDQEDHTFSKGEHAASALPSDSELSSLGSMNQKAWNAASGESQLSTGAEALFKTLQSPEEGSSGTLTLPAPDAQEASNRHSSDNAECTPTPDDHAAEFSSERLERYAESEADDEESAADYAHRRRTWRSTIAHAAYDSLLERHGAQEMQRQELIWEMCESEAAFIREMRNVVRTFVQPLRTQERKWIPGVPPDVMRLFDWLDDIVQLHAQMFSALHSARSKQYPIVTYIAETLRPFVPRLELHQPYLVRLDSASRVVEELIADSSSDFGEFARMQLQLPEWSSKTLTTALRLPTTHCMDYPAQFQKLWQCTPRSHPDHLATFSLYHSTELIVRVMLEVRSREEEYERVKDLSTRISGLPHNFALARRERRLVAQGLLRRVQLSEQERAVLDGDEPGLEEPLEVPLCMPILSPQYHTMRSFSPSLSSTDWLKSPRSLATVRPDVRNSMASSPSFASSITSDQDDDSRAPTPRGGPLFSSRQPRSKQKDALVYVFVFTDLVLLTTRMEARDDFETESFRLVDDVGMARVLGVTDHSGKLGELLLSLDVLPMPQEHDGVNVVPKDCFACPVYLSLSERAARAPSKLMEEAKQQWMQAFHKCFMFTLRSLSFPCRTGDDLSHGPTIDYEMDTKTSVMSILSSGLPLPKSPSQLIGEHERGRPSNAVIEEREERGWWANRLALKALLPLLLGECALRPPQIPDDARS